MSRLIINNDLWMNINLYVYINIINMNMNTFLFMKKENISLLFAG